MIRENSKGVEVPLVQGRLWQLAPEAASRFEGCRVSHRFMAFQGKELVVYKLFIGKPSVVSVLSCRGASLDFTNGISSMWATPDRMLTVGHTPIEVAPSVFLWHTYHSDLQYVPHKGVYATRFSMLFKAKHHPSVKIDGEIYIQERAGFDMEFGK